MIFSRQLLMSATQPLTAEGYPLVFSSNRDKQARDWSITGTGVGDIGEDGLYHLNVVNEPINLFNAMTGRTKKTLQGFDASTVRTFTGNGYYVGLSASNYYYSPNVKDWTIVNDNEIVVSSVAVAYGVSFDFAVKPGEKYSLSHLSHTTGTRRPVCYSYYAEDGSYLRYGGDVVSGDIKAITIPNNCYWLVLCLDSNAGQTQTYSDIMLTRIENADFEPYREPIVTEVVLDEPINGTVTYKDGILPPLQACKGTNVISVDGVENSNNLFNAKTGRTRKYFTGDTNWANTEKRPFTGSGYYVGLSSTNYYVPSNISSFQIISDNELSVTNISELSSVGYGVAVDFAVKPDEKYALSYRATTTGTETRPVTYAYYGEDGTAIKDGYIYASTSSITIPDNCYWLVFVFGAMNGTTQTYYDIQFELTNNTEYEPYRPKTNMSIKY